MFYEDAVTMTKPTNADDLLSPEGACLIYERLIAIAETNPGFASNRMLNDYKAKLAEYQQQAADEKEARMQAARIKREGALYRADVARWYRIQKGTLHRPVRRGR